jgi:uncharacterized membrane protein YccF (DUF307 family)
LLLKILIIKRVCGSSVYKLNYYFLSILNRILIITVSFTIILKVKTPPKPGKKHGRIIK